MAAIGHHSPPPDGRKQTSVCFLPSGGGGWLWWPIAAYRNMKYKLDDILVELFKL